MDNTLRIPGNRDEGIVQPVPKGADRLSRRLHHWPMAAGVMPGGHLFYPSGMARYATVRALSPTEAAYVAGIVDGEGTVTLTTMHAGENRRLVVSVASTERCLLDHLANTIGAGRITSKRTYSTKHTPSFTFRVTNRHALDLLRHIAPYLQTYKRQRAALALSHYLALTPRNGKYSPLAKAERRKFERQFLALRAGRNSLYALAPTSTAATRTKVTPR